MRQQAMDTGDADIVKVLDAVAHDLSSDHSFLGDRNVTSAGRDDGDGSLAVLLFILLQSNAARELMIFSFARNLLHRGEMLRRGARYQDVIFVSRELLKDSCDLRRSLPRSQNHLGHAGADGAVMIHF